MTISSTSSQQALVLVIDDEPDLRTLYELTLLREGYRVESAGDLRDARAHLKEQQFHAVITDMRLPDGMGLELLKELTAGQRPERCVVITAHGSAQNAVEALKAGAFDYLTKPVDLKQFRSVVASAIQGGRQTMAAVQPAKKEPPPAPAATPSSPGKPRQLGSTPTAVAASGLAVGVMDKLVGDSAPMRSVKSRIAKVASSMAPILIQG